MKNVMAGKTKQTPAPKIDKVADTKEPSTGTGRWVFSFVLMFLALFVFIAIASYYFTWSDDQLFFQNEGVKFNDISFSNLMGGVGAYVGYYLVSRFAGVFGVCVPVVLMLLAFRIMRYRPLVLERSLRITVIVMLLGSLTAGYIFKNSWGIFGSGLGGMCGWQVALKIEHYINWGEGLLLFMSWILFAVYLNRRTINVVNKAGEMVAQKAVDVFTLHRTESVEADTADNTLQEPIGEQQKQSVPITVGRPVTTTSEENGAGEELEEIEIGRSHHEQEDDDIVVNHETTVDDMTVDIDDTVVVNPFRDKTEEAEWRRSLEQEEHAEQETAYVELDGEPVQAQSRRRPQAEYGRRRSSSQSDDLEVVPTVDGSTGMAGMAIGATHSGDAVAATATCAPTTKVVPEAGTEKLTPNSDGQEENFAADDENSGTATLGAGGVVESMGANGMTVVMRENTDMEADEDDIEANLYDPTRELSTYKRPPLQILERRDDDVEYSTEEINENKDRIMSTLNNFGIKINRIKATVGPTVTLYEIEPAQGIKLQRIKSLESNIALDLKALSIRMIVPIPGKGTIGIEIPNRNRQTVSMYSVVKSLKFQESKYELPVVLGKTIQNETFMVDLTKMPHLLVAGATGQGKSVGLNVIIASLLYKKHPAELKFVMVDPKKVELSIYSKLEKYFLAKMESEDTAILTDTQKVVYTLNSLCSEMEARYELLRMAEAKKITEYNDKFLHRRLNPKKGHRFLPYIVVVIDEFADMIMTAGKEVEAPITRLAQLARAVGIHLIIATQRPDVKVITGLIKANFPARIAFRVMSMVDSRTILDQPGANQLVGMGDMLMLLNGEMTRLQCAFIDTPEIERIISFISKQKSYTEAYALPDYTPEGGASPAMGGDTMDADRFDPAFKEVARFVVSNQVGSTSAIQRNFSFGYNKAGRLMDQLERAGIVGRQDGSKPREVLVYDMPVLEDIFAELHL